MRTVVTTVLVSALIIFGRAFDSTAGMITIDFEDLGVPAGTQINLPDGVSQNSDGFTFTPGPINISGFNDLHFHNQNGIGDNGSTHLGTHDDVVMTRLGGGAFSLLGFDFNGYLIENEIISVTAQLQGGGSVAMNFAVDGIASPDAPYQSLVAGPPFVNVVSLTWQVGNPFGVDGFFLDNIVVETPNGTAAPEPSTLLLLGAGLLGLAARRRRV